MATFTPSKKNITDFNGGEEYQNGSGLQAETINNIIESQLYTQGLAKNAPNVTEANQEGTATVTIEQTADGTPRLKFANLKGAKGEKGEKGDKGDAGSIANLDEVVAPLIEHKADKYIFFDTENPVKIQSGMDLSGQTIAISSFYDRHGKLIQFENGKYIGAVMGTFGLFPSTSEYTAEVVFWEYGSCCKEQYTFPTGQGWTVTSVDSSTYRYINIIEHKVVDCEYNYKRIQNLALSLFEYTASVISEREIRWNFTFLSSDPSLIEDYDIGGGLSLIPISVLMSKGVFGTGKTILAVADEDYNSLLAIGVLEVSQLKIARVRYIPESTPPEVSVTYSYDNIDYANTSVSLKGRTTIL